MRIVVVEDEEKIRNGIIRLIHKLSKTYQVVGECSNGLDGVEYIKQMNPDLVITDIRMPVMNGIEMLEILKKEGITPRTIILSGYSDFEFAQKALHIGGVIEYLLKPVTADDLTQVLLKADKETTNQLLNGMPQSKHNTEREQMVKHILTQTDFDFERVPLHVKELFGVDPALDCHAGSVYVGRQYGEFAAEVKSRLHRTLDQDSRVNGFTIVEFPELDEIGILLQMKSSSYSINNLWGHLLGQLRSLQLDDLVITSTDLPHIKDLKDAVHEVRSIRKWSLIFGSCSHFDKHTISAVNSRIFHYPSEWELNIKEALSGHDQNKLKKNVELFVAHCTKQAADPVSVIDACIRFASTILHVAGVMLGDVIITKDQNDIYHRLSLVQTPNELQRALLETADKIADKFAQIPKSHSLVINKSVKIIQDKYSSGITLEELANSFNLTPEYLSSLFQKELGISFTAYIKDIRIKKAKELLMRSQLKAFEVAERVGYSDAKYFSRVFKEVTGLTPGEFQKLHR